MPTNALINQESTLMTEQRMSTRELLVKLGFAPVIAQFTDEQPGYHYNFGNLDLQASQVTGWYLRPEMHFTGMMSTPSTFGMIDFSLLMDVESFEQGVALIAFNIGKDFKPLQPTAWLEQGHLWTDHLPGRRELRLFEERPRCHVEAEWFRVAVKKLVAHGACAREDQTFEVKFRDGVLQFVLHDQVLVMPATGKNWPASHFGKSQGLTQISKRTPSQGVSIGIWKNRLAIDRVQLELVTFDASDPCPGDG